ncbi:6-phosphofructokinase [Desulfococcus sp.]|uniref:6-phosphofructokinase n=1 Tax=Desulfococcus sp. TaxID=2025834 RepID=UPI003593AF8E
MTDIKRIGILTGGGDCPGLNAVIRAVVRCAVGRYDIECLGVLDSFDGLIEGPSIIPLSWYRTKGLLFQGGTILGSTNRGDPFAYKVRVGEQIVEEDRSEAVMANVEKLDLDGLIIIGGDGTMAIANKFWERKKLRMVGVPKTIDNDIWGTDETFGFHTAVEIATDALDRLQTTATSHHRVMILETMGRNAGWIALHAGAASGADVILIPEIPFSLEAVVAKIEERSTRGSRSTIICAAEGAAPIDGTRITREFVPEAAEPVRLGGIAEWLCKELKGRIRTECRHTVLGHIQRGGIPSGYDRILCTRLGTAAVHAFVKGEFGKMVALRQNEIQMIPFAEIAGKNRFVDPGNDLVRAARDTGVAFGDE